MKKLLAPSLIVVLFVIGCQPSQNAVSTAIAQTQAAIPTLTYTPEPTSTPAPTNTPVPTKTKKPTATADYNSFTAIFPDLVANLTEAQLGKKIEVLDMEYSGSSKPTSLTLRLNVDKSKFKAGEATGATLQILSLSIQNDPSNFPNSLETLIIQEYDGLTQRANFSVGWDDMIDFANGKITSEQLILRGIIQIK